MFSILFPSRKMFRLTKTIIHLVSVFCPKESYLGFKLKQKLLLCSKQKNILIKVVSCFMQVRIQARIQETHMYKYTWIIVDFLGCFCSKPLFDITQRNVEIKIIKRKCLATFVFCFFPQSASIETRIYCVAKQRIHSFVSCVHSFNLYFIIQFLAN